MAIDRGPGTEIIRTVQLHALNNTSETLIYGVRHHIYTVLSIIVTETGGASMDLRIMIDDDGSTEVRLVNDHEVTAKETFVWNDKFVLSGTDCLRIVTAAAEYYHYTVSYIDQDWT